MKWLLDTSILIATIHNDDLRQTVSLEALQHLLRKDEELCVFPQNLTEFWAVATRPVTSNGYGLSTADAENEIAQIKLQFILKREDETIFKNWERLVRTYSVSGKPTHDARIVAAMQTHQIENLLTFNISDFKRYSPMINVFAPDDLIG